MNKSASVRKRNLIECYWEITNACNLKCAHCLVSSGKRAPDELTTEEALAFASELADSGCRRVALTGGEPLTRPDWPKLATRLVSRGVEVIVTTNGLLVDDETISVMRRIGIKGVAISLDGLKEAHDSIRKPAFSAGDSNWDRTVGAIERLASSPLKTAIITQIHKRNIDDLAEIFNIVNLLKVDLWQVQLAIPRGRLLEIEYEYLLDPSRISGLIEKLAVFIKSGKTPIAVSDNIGYFSKEEPVIRRSHGGISTFWTGCYAGLRFAGVCSNGDVKGCLSLPDSFVVGNVRRTPFREIWADAENFAYNTRWDETLLEGKCAECEFKRICRAGCRAMAYAVTGTVYVNPFCIRHAACGENQV